MSLKRLKGRKHFRVVVKDISCKTACPRDRSEPWPTTAHRYLKAFRAQCLEIAGECAPVKIKGVNRNANSASVQYREEVPMIVESVARKATSSGNCGPIWLAPPHRQRLASVSDGGEIAAKRRHVFGENLRRRGAGCTDFTIQTSFCLSIPQPLRVVQGDECGLVISGHRDQQHRCAVRFG